MMADDALAESALVLQPDHVGPLQDGETARASPPNRRAGCSFSHPRLTTSGCPREIGMQADVLQRADGHGGARAHRWPRRSRRSG